MRCNVDKYRKYREITEVRKVGITCSLNSSKTLPVVSTHAFCCFLNNVRRILLWNITARKNYVQQKNPKHTYLGRSQSAINLKKCKTEHTCQKSLLCIWWKSMLFYELLQLDETVTAATFVSWLIWPTKSNRKDHLLDEEAGRSFCMTTHNRTACCSSYSANYF